MEILEMENVKNTIKRLFEYRERKIIELALLAARTGAKPENLSEEEKKLFFVILDGIKGFGRDIAEKLDGYNKDKESKSEMDKEANRVFFKVIKSSSEFVGPDLKIYNLKQGDIVEVPDEIAKILLKEGIIEHVKG